MSRGKYSPAKRDRENQRANKKQEKAERRARKREVGSRDIPVTTADEMTGPLPTVEEAMREMERRRTAPRSAASIPARLFVGGISDVTTADHLREAFGRFGNVLDAVVVKDRDTGASRGFAFVTMESRNDAPKAIREMNDSVLDGRTIVVNPATERR